MTQKMTQIVNIWSFIAFIKGPPGLPGDKVYYSLIINN